MYSMRLLLQMGTGDERYSLWSVYSEATNYGRKTAPMLRIQGLWFRELGFNIGDPVLVKCEDRKLVIMKDSTRAELIEAEKTFMEEETRKLHERFLKEKKELHATFVAETKPG